MQRTAALTTINGKPVGRTGYGLMGFTSRPYAPVDYAAATSTMKQALTLGASLWNGGTFYGPPTSNSLHLLAHYFATYPEDSPHVVLSIKGAYDRATHTPDGSPAGIRASVDECLRTLPPSVKTIDVFQLARLDPGVPLETSMAALKELVAEGKIGGIGLSEVSGRTIRRAHAMHPISAVEIELSLFTTDALLDDDDDDDDGESGDKSVASTCRELGIPLVAYSPLSRGFLTGQIRSPADIPEGDFRKMLPRFQPDAFDDNLKLVRAVEEIATGKGCTGAQVAIAWVRAQGAVPIPGATGLERVRENCEEVELSDGELGRLGELVRGMPVRGARYPEAAMKWLSQ